METSDNGIAKIKGFEGFRLVGYADSGGVPTIGYGHTGPEVRVGMKITEAQATAYLKDDLSEAEDAVNELVTVDITQNQFDALVSFVYNVGVNAFRRSTLLRKLNSGRYDQVPDEFMKWVYDNGRRVTGLVNRRAAEVGMWSKGSFVTSQNIVPQEVSVAKASISPEIIATGAVPIATSVVGAAATNTAIGYAVAAVIVVAAVIGAIFIVRRIRNT